MMVVAPAIGYVVKSDRKEGAKVEEREAGWEEDCDYILTSRS